MSDKDITITTKQPEYVDKNGRVDWQGLEEGKAKAAEEREQRVREQWDMMNRRKAEEAAKVQSILDKAAALHQKQQKEAAEAKISEELKAAEQKIRDKYRKQTKDKTPTEKALADFMKGLEL